MSSDVKAQQHVTTLLRAWANGSEQALDELVPLVHHELRRLAQQAMSRERADHTLQPTALVNEIYLRLVDIKNVQWKDRNHFFALSARLMRRTLVDLARARGYQKRGGDAPIVPLHDSAVAAHAPGEDILALDEALERLAAIDPRRSQVVELRFFGGFSVEETAEIMGVSRHTVMRDWTLARTWLYRELRRPATF